MLNINIDNFREYLGRGRKKVYTIVSERYTVNKKCSFCGGNGRLQPLFGGKEIECCKCCGTGSVQAENYRDIVVETSVMTVEIKHDLSVNVIFWDGSDIIERYYETREEARASIKKGKDE